MGVCVKPIEFEVPWIPAQQLRGNGLDRSTHWEKGGLRETMRTEGYVIGHQLLIGGSETVDSPCHVRVQVTNPRRIDLDNLLIGYKALWDGLQDSGLLKDDGLIETITIHRAGKGGAHAHNHRGSGMSTEAIKGRLS